MSDEHFRAAAFARVTQLAQIFGDDIPWSAIATGAGAAGETFLLANKAVGIFRPRKMSRGILSIKTTKPRKGRINVYEDRESEDGDFVYSLQGSDPGNHFNRSLAEAHEDRTPFIYFHAVAAGVYKAIFPCYVSAIDTETMTCRVTVGVESVAAYQRQPQGLYHFPSEIDRRYAVREAKVRLHQATFREMVLSAYSRKCAMTGLPVPELLEAAHIIPDAHEQGEASVSNGICLSKIHHRAFDANLIGVDPDFRVVVSERLLVISDGPVLEEGIKALNGGRISLPADKELWPKREFLEQRHAEFKAWKWSS